MLQRTVRRRSQPPPRVVSRPEVRALHRVARESFAGPDIYHWLLTLGWRGLFGLMACSYVLFNVIFAFLYWLQPGSVANARPGSFPDAFFFSVQTMATIGYGDMHPATLYANLVVTGEVLLGLTGFALATGLIFARFSRPTARVLFSRVAVVARHEGVPTLMFRAANERLNRILEAQVSVTVAREEVSAEGVAMRRFHELKVTRSRTPLFLLTWTVMHPIDEASPLRGATRDSLIAEQAEIVVTLIGIDETFSQTIYARHSYGAEQILWGHRLADILAVEDGRRRIDYGRFHDTVAADP